MHTLAIDTSNQALGVAILKNKELIGEVVTNIAKNHSVRLMPAIEYLMDTVQVSVDQLNKIVVAKGPGSYTGVRIGLTTAKTLAWSLNIPIVGVSSLEILAYRASFSNSLICPFFDARRGLVYTGLYESREGSIELVEKDQNTSFAEWLDKLSTLNQKIIFLSPDMEKNVEIIRERLGDNAIIPQLSYHTPRPSDIALAAANKESEDTHTITPNYLRLAEAEANWLKAQKDK